MLRWHIHILILELPWFLGISLVWLLDVNVLGDIFVELIEFAYFWSQHSSNVFLLIFVIVIINSIVIVEEIVGSVRGLLLEASHWLVKIEFWNMLEPWSRLFKPRLVTVKALNIFLVLKESFLQWICLFFNWSIFLVVFTNGFFGLEEIIFPNLVLLAGEEVWNLVVKVESTFLAFIVLLFHLLLLRYERLFVFQDIWINR